MNITVIWDVMLHSLVGGYKCFGGTCSVYVQDRRVTFLPRRWRQQIPLKRYQSSKLHSVTSQKHHATEPSNSINGVEFVKLLSDS
jgi:hypothetical protein